MACRKIPALTLLLAALLAKSSAADEEICTTPVKTVSGMVQGLSEKNGRSCVWRGIPYAAPPVGELRWKAPQPAPAWQGVRDGSVWGARCMQSGIMEMTNYDPSGRMSEDCLYLNIWRPNKPGKFPVMFWIHGGGYTGGTGNTQMYWGDRLAANGDVEVVTINYRLNVFGFLTLPALRSEDPNRSTGNYGSLDQLLALKWVKDNIAGFGGDPDNITIFGESAGGHSVFSLIASPLARGLFQKAIVESGGVDLSATLDKGYEQGKKIAESMGCGAEDLACLRKLPAKKLLKAAGNATLTRAFGPHSDGYFLNGSPREMIASGQFNRTPILAGSNKDEMSVMIAFHRELCRAKPEQYEKYLQSGLDVSEAEARKIAELYPLSEFDNQPRKAYGQMITDYWIPCSMYDGLVLAAGYESELYLYRFDYHNIKLGDLLGAAHSFEMAFVFNALDRNPGKAVLKDENLEEMAALSRLMQGYWVNFAKTGNPNGPGLPLWPKFSLDSQKFMVLDVNPRSETSTFADRCRLWNDYREKHPELLFLFEKPKK